MTARADLPPGRDAFDAALVPGMRARLAEAYRRFRSHESRAVSEMAPDGGRVGYVARPCPACGTGTDGVPPLLVAKGLDILSCPDCGLAHTRVVMDAGADAARYATGSIDAESLRLRREGPYQELEQARARYYLRALHVAGAVSGALLEIGCGTGTLLAEAQAAGWRVTGLEPNAAAADVARGHGVPVTTGYFPGDLPPEPARFDVIAMLDVLEHMAEPRPFLAVVEARLAAGGRLLVQVPNFDSPLVHLDGEESSVLVPGHWTHFTPATLPALLAREGLHALAIGTVVSELDRIRAFPDERVAEVLGRLRPSAALAAATLDASGLHAHGLGYKLVGIFAHG